MAKPPIAVRSRHHGCELAPVVPGRRPSASCDVCHVEGLPILYYCSDCDWDICESCFRLEPPVSSLIPPVVIEEVEPEDTIELCNSISSFSLDPAASRVWSMRQVVLNRVHKAISKRIVESKKREDEGSCLPLSNAKSEPYLSAAKSEPCFRLRLPTVEALPAGPYPAVCPGSCVWKSSVAQCDLLRITMGAILKVIFF